MTVLDFNDGRWAHDGCPLRHTSACERAQCEAAELQTRLAGAILRAERIEAELDEARAELARVRAEGRGDAGMMSA